MPWLGLGVVAAAVAVGHGGAGAAPPPDYRISVERAVTVTEGERTAVSLTVAARAGYSISRDGPLSLSLSAAPEGAITLPRSRYRRADAADAHAENPRFDLALVAGAAGQATLTIDVHFWVCAKRTCRPVHDQRQVRVTIQAKAPPPPPPDAGQ